MENSRGAGVLAALCGCGAIMAGFAAIHAGKDLDFYAAATGAGLALGGATVALAIAALCLAWVSASYLALARARQGSRGALVRWAARRGIRRVRVALAVGVLSVGVATPAMAAPALPAPPASMSVLTDLPAPSTPVPDLGWGSASAAGVTDKSASTTDKSADVTRESASMTGESAGGSHSGTAPGAATSTRPAPPVSTYTVLPGESLWNIAASLLPAGASDAVIARTIHALVQANNITNPSLIHPGDVLSVPALSVQK
ncbi:LysM peptidoglycan-binding domain-containing protein [Neoactinobaculum massilliense]|uniref:LysM peptidoglycan-binding domain-containing protein n=1 Tax=Neoactinobaculum massilliense TaxID=2364794 RepID=UPI000F52550F|nr:LysM domain-containing protein [Neoactinobaculum massilliense]